MNVEASRPNENDPAGECFDISRRIRGYLKIWVILKGRWFSYPEPKLEIQRILFTRYVNLSLRSSCNELWSVAEEDVYLTQRLYEHIKVLLAQDNIVCDTFWIYLTWYRGAGQIFDSNIVMIFSSIWGWSIWWFRDIFQYSYFGPKFLIKIGRC